MSDETGSVDETRNPIDDTPSRDADGQPSRRAGTDTRGPQDAAARDAANEAPEASAAPGVAPSSAEAADGHRPRGERLVLADANLLRSGTLLKVLRPGMVRQDLEGESAEGTYVSQFDSPTHGRMVVVHLPGRGNFGFRLDELRRVEI